MTTISGIDFPSTLVTALRNHELVVFAGAGVSKEEPANLHNFRELANAIAEGTVHTLKRGEREDRFLGRLKHENIDVHTRAANVLRTNLAGRAPQPTALHTDLVRLFGQPNLLRIVTTNFDLLFSDVASEHFDLSPEVFKAPALPLGSDFTGIVHVHGSVERPSDMVLTDADFGRAYLTVGWTRRFLVELFRRFTVLFVGYSHTDTVMQYLARALPMEGPSRRFGLISENKADRDEWELHGIQPIPYPESAEDAYARLRDGVRALADYATRGVLDWQREITHLAKGSPPVDDDSASIVDEAFSDPKKTHFFTSVATDPQWVDWIDRRGHVNRFFDVGELPEHDRQIASWLAERFSRLYPIELFSLVARHKSHLNPILWSAICREIIRSDATLPAEVLDMWTSLLLSTANAALDYVELYRLAARCAEQGLTGHVVEIFDALIDFRLTLMTRPKRPYAPATDSLPGVDAYITQNDCSGNSVKRLWRQVMMVRLEEFAEPSLSRVTSRLSARHDAHRVWKRADPGYDPDSYQRRAIEPNDKNFVPKALDVLIDVARDCLEYMAWNAPEVVARWCNDHANAESALLRRLAVHTISERTDINADDKCQWLLDRVKLHDELASHEIARILRQIYLSINDSLRRALIETIRANPNPRDLDNDNISTRRQIQLLRILQEVDPDCELVGHALDQVTDRYTKFGPRVNVNQSDAQSSRAVERGLLSVDYLLSQRPVDLLDDLLSAQSTGIVREGRNGLLSCIEKVAKLDLQWGIDLSDALIGTAHWSTDLWVALLSAWSQGELYGTELGTILQRLESRSVRDSHTDAICHFLCESFKPPRAQGFAEFLDRANALAADMWTYLDPTDHEDESPDDWLCRAINHPAGDLAQFWIYSLLLWRRSQKSLPPLLGEDYLSALDMIIRDRTTNGALGQCVLCRGFAIFLEVDEGWTKENLLPLFDAEDDLPFSTAAWSGFLYGSRSDSATRVVKPSFLSATPRLQTDFREQHLAERFIEAYTYVLFYYVEDPNSQWIPRLFEYTNVEGRERFCHWIWSFLDSLDETQQREYWERWLKQHWEDRINGVPVSLCSEEIDTMLSWIPRLHAILADAVKLAVQMPRMRLESCFVLDEIIEAGIHDGDPVSVAKLLGYLRHCQSKKHVWKSASGLIHDLLRADIQENSKQILREILAEYEVD